MISTNVDRTEFEKKMELILEYKNSGNYLKAIEVAEMLTAEFSQEASAFGLLASLNFMTEKYEKASISFKKTTVLAPKSETASLGLFHSLWRLNDHEGAFVEMKRFTAIVNSEEYDNLIKEMNK